MLVRRLVLAVCLVPFLGCSDGAVAPTERPAELTGVVVAIDGEGFDEVESFTLRAGANNHEIWIDPGRDYSFPLNHLHAHLRGAEPVRVEYEEQDGRMIAVTIEDV